MKKYRVMVISLLIGMLFLSLSSAYVGLSPPRYYLEFEPGKEAIFDFDFFTDESLELEIYAAGDLAEYVTLSTDRVQGSERVSVLLELPKKIEVPGEHIIYIGARQKPAGDSVNGIQLVADVRGTIRVFVPYPGKYAVMNFNAYDARLGETFNASVSVASQGLDAINLNGKVDLINSRNQVVASSDISNWKIAAGTSDTKYIIFDSDSIIPGRYTARASLEYEEGTLKDEKTIRIGELLISINSYTKALIRDKLNKFDVGIESQWNDPIEGVYANVTVLDYPITFTTPSIKLEGFQSANLTGYFETSPIQEDSAKIKILIMYDDHITEKTVKLKFKKDLNVGLIALIGGIVFAVLVIVVLLLYIRKLNQRKSVYEKKKRKK